MPTRHWVSMAMKAFTVGRFSGHTATGWELEDAFTEANVRQLLVMHPSAALSVYQTYIRTSRIGREKN